jgi:hypothetical protein
MGHGKGQGEREGKVTGVGNSGSREEEYEDAEEWRGFVEVVTRCTGTMTMRCNCDRYERGSVGRWVECEHEC